MTKNRIGEVNYSSSGEKIVIINYSSCMDMDVKFDSGYIAKNVRYGDFKSGKIKNPLETYVYGYGYFGVGKFSSASEHYTAWRSMMQRCYDEKFHKRKPSYTDCHVSEEWNNYQNFAQWYEENYYALDNERMHLDKDIIVKGNKIYSPNTCIFVPQTINSLFVKQNRANDEGLPIGVYYSTNRNKFLSYCNEFGKKKNLGGYYSAEEAFFAYKSYKEEVIKQVASKYKGKIPNKLYEFLIRYQVQMND